jgi:hypothetical protein
MISQKLPATRLSESWTHHLLIFICKSAQPNETKLDRNYPWEGENKNCASEVPFIGEGLVDNSG